MSKILIKCDNQGLILEIGNEIMEAFGYEASELINKKHISFLSAGENIVNNVWICMEKASRFGACLVKKAFKRKDGSFFYGQVRISPTISDPEDSDKTEYIWQIEVLEEAVIKEFRQDHMLEAISSTRLPFLTAAISPVLVAGAYAWKQQQISGDFNYLTLVLMAIAVVILHYASNVISDYFLEKDGAVDEKSQYLSKRPSHKQNMAGIVQLISSAQRYLVILLFLVVLILAYLTYQTDVITLALAVAGALVGYLYIVPPLPVFARRGAGELVVSFGFATLLTTTTYYVLTKEISWDAFHLGMPIGFLTANILIINQFPIADGKYRPALDALARMYKKKSSATIYLFVLLMAVLSYLMIYFMTGSSNQFILMISAFTFILGFHIYSGIKSDFMKRGLVRWNIKTILLASSSAIFFSIALILG
jgi:1,4-dihydroxy-2-naphthoate polyprenyltransferase